jgi:hypothetical protein
MSRYRIGKSLNRDVLKSFEADQGCDHIPAADFPAQSLSKGDY